MIQLVLALEQSQGKDQDGAKVSETGWRVSGDTGLYE